MAAAVPLAFPPTQLLSSLPEDGRHKSTLLTRTTAIAVKRPPTVASSGDGLSSQRSVIANYAGLLQSCLNMVDEGQGRQIHAQIITKGIHMDLLDTKLVSMYAACGSVGDARIVFDMVQKQLPSSSSSSLWNAMIRGYVKNGCFEEALILYCRMQHEVGIKPDSFTFSCLPMACAGLSSSKHGDQIHNHVLKNGFESNVFVGNALVAMYSQFSRVDLARQVFDKMSERSVVSWTAMIAGYAQNLHSNEALNSFREMQMQQPHLKPNPVTIVSVLPACGHLEALETGKEIHSYIVKNGFDQSNALVGSSLVAMYCQCGKIDIAQQIFDRVLQKSIFLWNAMLAGYAQTGHANEAIQFFSQMVQDNVKPNCVTILSVLPAFACLSLLQQGREIHGYIFRNGFECHVAVGNALIDMYSKCGCVELARHVFEEMSLRNEVSWTAMISGYGMNGHGEDALACFKEMQRTRLIPNHITFVAVLSACSHTGLVSEGQQYFECMSRDYQITPRMEHYACVVDLLGRAGLLDEAESFIQAMPVKPNASVWGALLAACTTHGNINLGQRVGEQLLELESDNDGNYILLSNVYAAAGKWDHVAKVRTIMKARGLKQRPGCSWIRVKNKVHRFFVGDRSHPQSQYIYAMLESLTEQSRELGYFPDTRFVLHDVDEEEKENILSAHSEKLAIAFGVLKTCPGTPIRVIKNLRMCRNCHSATKYVSKIVSREIFVRDTNRFHQFKDGVCSCGDYW